MVLGVLNSSRLQEHFAYIDCSSGLFPLFIKMPDYSTPEWSIRVVTAWSGTLQHRPAPQSPETLILMLIATDVEENSLCKNLMKHLVPSTVFINLCVSHCVLVSVASCYKPYFFTVTNHPPPPQMKKAKNSGRDTIKLKTTAVRRLRHHCEAAKPEIYSNILAGNENSGLCTRH